MTGTIQEFDYSVNLLQALLWQYESAENLQALLQEKQDWYTENQTDFWTNWYTDVFDLRTANDFGLTVWGIILGQKLYINFAQAGRPAWGFEEFHLNFTRGNFSGGSERSVRMSTETSRIILRLRYYQLISAGCVPEINRMLQDVFADYVAPGDTAAYVVDNYDMTMTYNFLFELSTELLFALRFFDVLPRPSGVQSTIVIV